MCITKWPTLGKNSAFSAMLKHQTNSEDNVIAPNLDFLLPEEKISAHRI
jgi:hypothetical protein